MKLIKCANIPGHPKHRIETCWERKEKANGLSKKEASSSWKHGTGTGDYFYDLCFDCDPTTMETVEFNTGAITAPILKKKFKKRVLKSVNHESGEKEKKMVKKVEYKCKQCGEKTDNPDKFIHEKGTCRKCYMKDYYKRNPKKKGSVLAPKKPRQSKDVVEKMLSGAETVTPKGKVLDSPVKDFATLRDVVDAGGEVSIAVGKAWQFVSTEDVVVNFTKHPDLFDFLKEMADKDFRSPEMEILALLNEKMGRRDGK